MMTATKPEVGAAALDWALWYASQGFHVFPCPAGQKSPAGSPYSSKQATTDPEQIKAWYADDPDLNIAIRLDFSGLMCVDVDSYKSDCKFWELIADLELPRTMHATTARGGTHLLFQRTADAYPRHLFGDSSSQVDIQTAHHIMVHPSTFEGRQYGPLSDDPIAPAPAFLAEKARPSIYGDELPDMGPPEPRLVPVPANSDPWAEAALSKEIEAVLCALEGSRNNTLNAAAFSLGQLVAGGYLTENRVRAELEQAGVAIGLDRAEISKTIASGLRSGAQSPREKPAAPEKVRQAPAPRPAPVPTTATQAEKPARTILFHDSVDVEPILDQRETVEDFVPWAGIGFGFGPPGSFKTFTAIDLAGAVGGDKQWHGKRVENGVALYCGLEGERGIKNRIAARNKAKGPSPGLKYFTGSLNLRSNQTDADAIVAAARVASGGEPIRLLVIDTMNRAMAGGNENSSEDVGAFVAIVDSIARELDCFVLVIHHSGKDDARGLRGHSSLEGAADMIFEVKDKVINVLKQKDGDLVKYGFEVESVELGVDQYGKAITSLIVQPAAITEKTPELRGLFRTVMERFDERVLDHGVQLPSGDGFPPAAMGIKGVRKAEFLKVIEDLWSEATRPDSKAAAKLRELIHEKRRLCERDGYLWKPTRENGQ